MKYIEIANGLSIKIEAIEGVQDKDGMSSTVITSGNTYESTFPYNVLLQLLEMRSEPVEEKNEEMMNIFKQIGTQVP